MTATATFASLRSDLMIVEESAQPVFSGGRQIRTDPGVIHHFKDHRCIVKGAKSIEFIRQRIKMPDAPEVWELDASDVVEVTALLAELATAETDRVRDIRKAEVATSNRQIVLETCDRILQRAGVSERRPGEKVPGTQRSVLTG